MAALGTLVVALAAPAAPAAAADAVRIGYVNLAKVFDDYQRTKESEQALEARGKQRQQQLEGQLGKLKDLRSELDVLSDQAREAKTREIEEQSDEFKRLRTRSERELLTQRNQVAKQILDEITAVVTEYAQANGFSLVLDQRSLLYGQDTYNLTDEILKILNDRYAARKQQPQKKAQ